MLRPAACAWPRAIRLALVLIVATAVNACTPHAALVASVLQEPMLALLGNLQRVDERNLKQVIELERAGRWEELTHLAGEHLAKDPSNADWWLIRGYAQGQRRQHASAADSYREAVRLEPSEPVAWHLLAQAHRAAGEPRRAVTVLNNALLALRDTTTTHYLLGESYTELGLDREAAGAYREALARAPQFAPAWLGLSRALERLGEMDEARRARAQFERLDPALAARLR